MKALRTAGRFIAISIAAIAVALSTRAAPPEAPARIAPTTLSISCEGVQPAFDLALALLHAQVFPLAANAFRQVLQLDPACPMGHWGLAMAALGDMRDRGPTRMLLAEGAAAIRAAKTIGGRSERECELIDAAAQYFHLHHERDHATRLHAFELSLRRARDRFPGDAEIRAFHDRAFAALAHH